MKRTLKILGITITLLNVSLFIALVLSMFTVNYALMGSLMPEGGREPIRFEAATDPATRTTTINVLVTGRNQGVLDVLVRIGVKLLSPDGAIIAQGSDSKRIPAGSTAELSVKMNISAETILKYGLDSVKPTPALTFEFRTFFDLVGMSIEARG